MIVSLGALGTNAYNRGFNKGRSPKFREGSRVRQTPEEDRGTYRPKRCGNNNKDEDNSPKTLNDKNHQASSQKFRQIIHSSSKKNNTQMCPHNKKYAHIFVYKQAICGRGKNRKKVYLMDNKMCLDKIKKQRLYCSKNRKKKETRMFFDIVMWLSARCPMDIHTISKVDNYCLSAVYFGSEDK